MMERPLTLDQLRAIFKSDEDASFRKLTYVWVIFKHRESGRVRALWQNVWGIRKNIPGNDQYEAFEFEDEYLDADKYGETWIAYPEPPLYVRTGNDQPLTLDEIHGILKTDNQRPHYWPTQLYVVSGKDISDPEQCGHRWMRLHNTDGVAEWGTEQFLFDNLRMYASELGVRWRAHRDKPGD